ncbi:MAG: DUF3718 domain-containing protein [Colwelliaceae bacterium]|nr:DUF3718 domain-containing protein [Colwelliaceae bacterium]
MNKAKSIITAVITFSVLTSATFTSSAMDRLIEQSLIKVCKASTYNSVNRYNRIVKSFHLTDRTVATKVMCNGDPISDFARKHGSYKIARKLEKSMRGAVSITDIAARSKINVNFKE